MNCQHLVFAGLVLTGGAMAQQAAPEPSALHAGFQRLKILKINLLSPVVNTLTVAYENVLTPEKSFQLTLSIVTEGWFVVTPEFRYYLSETAAPEGVYVAPYLRYYQVDKEGILGGGLIIGKQGLYKKKITVDGFIGPSVNSTNPFEEEEVFFGIRAGVMLGINLSHKKK